MTSHSYTKEVPAGVVPYECGERVRLNLPAGHLSFIAIYEGSLAPGSTNEHTQRRYGFSVEEGILPIELTANVKVSGFDDRHLVHISAGPVRPEIHVAGLSSTDEEFRWLKDRQEEMKLRNIRPDGLFNRYPLIVEVARYEYKRPGPPWHDRHSRDCSDRAPLSLTGIGLGLRKLTIVAEEN